MSDLVHMLFDSLDKSETEERDVNIPYKPKWTPIVGGVLPNILLQQMRYWWVKQGKKPYFKFNDKCEHVAYRPGDSWIEELGFSRSEFETARSKIATRITSGMSKSEHLEYKTSDGDLQPVNRIVIYWRDKSGQMWYRINEMLWWAYRLKADNPHLGNAEILHYLEMQESRITYQMQESRITFSTETTTETTAESVQPALTIPDSTHTHDADYQHNTPPHIVAFEERNNATSHEWVKVYTHEAGLPTYRATRQEMELITQYATKFSLEDYRAYLRDRLQDKPGIKLLWALQDMPAAMAKKTALARPARTMSPAAPDVQPLTPMTDEERKAALAASKEARRRMLAGEPLEQSA